MTKSEKNSIPVKINHELLPFHTNAHTQPWVSRRTVKGTDRQESDHRSTRLQQGSSRQTLAPAFFLVLGILECHDWQVLESGFYYRAQTGLELVILLPQLLTCWNHGSLTSYPGYLAFKDFITHTTQFSLLACERPRFNVLLRAVHLSPQTPDTLLHPRQHSLSVSINLSIWDISYKQNNCAVSNFFDLQICLQDSSTWWQGLVLHFYYQVTSHFTFFLVTGG